jgi:phosphoribosyl 1,2-cyclic phosphate phosphodiesterase
MTTLTFTLLGCGHSGGTPAIGNHWGVCDPNNPRNRRTRPAAMIAHGEKTLLIDAGPDLKEQANRHNLNNVDAVLLTHSHSDHILGLEELRAFRLRHKKVIPVYCDQPTLDDVQRRFDYLFQEKHDIYPKVLEPITITADKLYQQIEIETVPLTLFYQDHGTCVSLGLRCGDLGYSTDMRDLDQQAIEILFGVKTWIVDAAAYRQTQNPVHANIDKVIELNSIIQAEHVYLTHMPPYMDYDMLCRELPPGYAPAYDGMIFEIDV